MAHEWTLAVTKPRAEAKAADNCRRQGLQVLAPRLRTTHVTRGRIVSGETYLFPSYLFVLQVSDHVYGLLRSTIGVARVLLMAGKPATCSEAVVEELQARMDDDGYVELPEDEPPAPPDFSAGKRVQVGDPNHILFGRRGVSQGMDARQRVHVLMSIMGRKVPVVMEYSSLAIA